MSPAVVAPTPKRTIPPKIGVAKTRAAAKAPSILQLNRSSAPGPEAEAEEKGKSKEKAPGSALDRQLEAMGLDLGAVETAARQRQRAAEPQEFRLLDNLKATLERASKPRPRFRPKAKAVEQ